MSTKLNWARHSMTTFSEVLVFKEFGIVTFCVSFSALRLTPGECGAGPGNDEVASD